MYICLVISTLLLTANAAPWPISSKHATHRRHILGQKRAEIETYHPRSSFKTYGAGLDQDLSLSKRSAEDSAIGYFVSQSEVSVDNMSIKVVKEYSSSHSSVVHMKQYYDDIPFANTAANVVLKPGNRIASFASSFVDYCIDEIPSTTPTISLDSVLSDIEDMVGGATSTSVAPYLAYLAREDAPPVLTYVVQIVNDAEFTHYQAYIDAHTGELVSIVNFSNAASYTVLPVSKQDITEGIETLNDPEDLTSSPEGWMTKTETAGNNVVAFKVLLPLTTNMSSSEGFDYKYDPSREPVEGSNRDASLTNGFYIANTLHDVWYRYGFTEEAGNFQDDNFGKGGLGGDRIRMSIQDTAKMNEASFITPPDGQSGKAQFFLWDYTSPSRDAGMENDIVVHEFTHGLTNRLTGGGTADCLQTSEAAGLGEGWSDAMAEWTALTSESVPDFIIGSYLIDSPTGLRSVPYSTDKSINSLMYSDMASRTEAHEIGEVWATILHGVLSTLVETNGLSKTAFTDSDSSEGNVVYLRLFVDALIIQPCNPTMLEARDSWIQADENRYDGEHICSLWSAFADRGLGVNAVEYTNDSTVPDGC